jgi:hypothetical protein
VPLVELWTCCQRVFIGRLSIGNSFTPGCSYQWLPAPMGWGPRELLHHADRRFEPYAGQKYPFGREAPLWGGDGRRVFGSAGPTER